MIAENFIYFFVFNTAAQAIKLLVSFSTILNPCHYILWYRLYIDINIDSITKCVYCWSFQDCASSQDCAHHLYESERRKL